jgi:hypothetical protein
MISEIVGITRYFGGGGVGIVTLRTTIQKLNAFVFSEGVQSLLRPRKARMSK